jgi:putative ATPase
MAANLSIFSENVVSNSFEKEIPEELLPLAQQVRPKNWDEYAGLDTFDTNLINFLKQGKGIPPSMLLWGPAGSGKTTFAKLVGKTFSLPFVEFSAVLGGVKDVREIIEGAKKFNVPTLLFMDEIHRFNRAQQDAFLPHIEYGRIVLIGATTENPSFYLNTALLSRCRVVPFAGLSDQSLIFLIQKVSKTVGVQFSEDTYPVFIEVVGGDARKLLNIVDDLRKVGSDKSNQIITRSDLEEFIQQAKVLYYDRSGEEHYNLASAFIKSLRGSDPDAALYWGLRMIESGEDPLFVIRRMIIFASEDIGNADPRALQLAVSTIEAFERIGMPEGRIPISQCITYLACAPKSNRSYQAMNEVLEDIKKHSRISVPLHLRNAPTKLMKNLDYGKGYQYPHEYENAYVENVQYLPEELKNRKYYKPSDRGYEKIMAERAQVLSTILKK